MLSASQAYSGFSVDDLDAAKQFYGETLELELSNESDEGLIGLKLGSGAAILVYPKGEGHVPAEFTVLNFPVENIEEAVDGLTWRGVEFERYDDFEQDDRGIALNAGPRIAWFKDPAGNVLSLIEEE